jgi:hypothetical protein
MAGYSSKPLIDKLGVHEGDRVIILHAPTGYLDLLPNLEDRAKLMKRFGVRRFNFIQYFASSAQQLGVVMPNLASQLEPNGTLWVSWAKRSSRLHSPDLDENVVRALGLRAGLVDVKVAAITADWSGLKFVYRLKDR